MAGQIDLAVIPARGGSKRIHHKNIRAFCGAPIISYTIKAAQSSSCFDDIIVSTDDNQIAQIASSLGASVPFFRSSHTSDDSTGIAEVLLEVLKCLESSGLRVKYLCCLLPTAPFVTAIRISKAKQLLIDSGADCVVPVVRFEYPVQRALRMELGKVKMVWPENYHKRSQDLELYYHDAGQFYWLTAESFKKECVLFMKRTFGIIIPETEVQDIDTEADWKLAELKFCYTRETGRE